MKPLNRLVTVVVMLTALLIIGCTPSKNAYRRAYGPGPWDAEVRMQNAPVDPGLAYQQPF